jgi:hypothetical protein
MYYSLRQKTLDKLKLSLHMIMYLKGVLELMLANKGAYL